MHHVKEQYTEKNRKTFNNNSVLDIKYESVCFLRWTFYVKRECKQPNNTHWCSEKPKHKVPLLGHEVRVWYTVSVCQIMRPVFSEEEKVSNCYVHLIVVPFGRELRWKVKIYLLYAGHCLGQHSKFLNHCTRRGIWPTGFTSKTVAS